MDATKKVLALILAAIVGVGVLVTVTTTTGPDGTKTKKTEVHIGPTTKVDNADQDAKANDTVELTPKARDVAKTLVEHPGDLVADKPNAPPLAGLGHQIAEGVIPFPWASDEIAGCRTRFLKVNFSARSVPQSQVIVFELHYTAGPDIPNSRADVDGLTAFGNRASSRVSWHLNMDKDGNCDYNVPLRSKAWTISGLNSYTINVEVAGRGESPYLRPAGYEKLASIIAQVRKAYPGIKLRVGATDGRCHPTKGGIDSHYRGGPCSGGHSDIRPHDLAKVVAAIRAASRPARSRGDVWRARHARIHSDLRTKCRSSAQRRGRTCRALRERNRVYHDRGLLSRP